MLIHSLGSRVRGLARSGRGLSCVAGLVVASSLRPSVAPGQDAGALVRQADSLFAAAQHAQALALYEAAFMRDSTAAHAVLRAAMLRSWRNEFDVALRLYRRYVALEPRDLDGRIGLARVLSWSGRFAQSVTEYDSALARDAGSRDAVLGRANALGKWGRFATADSAYGAWVSAHPADTAAALERADVLAWAGRYGEARAIYRSAGAASAAAAKGEARVSTWSGDLLDGEARWEALSRRFPNDEEVWVGLAQVRRWLGKARGARDALDTALRLKPGYADALEQRGWVDAELDLSGGVTMVVTHDSDENDATVVAVHGGIAMPAGRRLEATALLRRATMGSLDGNAASATVRWGTQSAGGRASVWLGAGVTSLTGSALPGGDAPDATLLHGSARIAVQLGTRFVVGVAGSRTPFDEIAGSIRSSVALDMAEADVSLRLPVRASLSASGAMGSVVRGAGGANARWAASTGLTWDYARNVALGVRTRVFGHERTAADGYFSPRRFLLTEFIARWHRNQSLGWQFGADGAIGAQRMRLADGDPVTSRGVWNASGLTGYRWKPGFEAILSGTYANVASVGTLTADADYRYAAASLSLRWLF
jgi:tetratricopeptide (TPR) repeat protein